MEAVWKELIFLKGSLYCSLLLVCHDLIYIMNSESSGEAEHVQEVILKLQIKTATSLPQWDTTLLLHLLKISINQVFIKLLT